MKEKPFYNIFPIRYKHKRNKYNPLRLIFGDCYMSRKIPHILFEMSDISFEPHPSDLKAAIDAKIAAKHLKNHVK